MKTESPGTPAGAAGEKPSGNWFDPIETELGAKVRGFIETMIEGELEMALARPAAAASLEEAGGGWRCGADRWPPARPADTFADRGIRMDGDRRSACPDPRRGRQVHKMEEQGVPRRSAPHEGG